jgi:drug/metabolite transporter (DMT)-like permease
MTQKKQATLLILICVALWGLLPITAKLGQASLNNHQYLFYSSLLSFISVGTVTILTKHSHHFFEYTLVKVLKIMGLGFLGTYLVYILLYFGYANAIGLEVLILHNSWPILISILSVFILKENLTPHRTLAMILGFIGIFLILTKGDISMIHMENIHINLIVLCGALSLALFSVLSKKVKLEGYTATTIFFFTATIASFFSMLFFSEFTPPTKSSIIPILLNGIFINGVSYIFFVMAFQKAKASYLAPFLFISPALSALYLVIFFNEPLVPIYAIGLITVISAGLLNR